jgi:hypothetical protein
MWGQPPPAVQERSSAAFDSTAVSTAVHDLFANLRRMLSQAGSSWKGEPGELSPARTAEGGCPHMVIGGHQLMTAIRNCLPTLSGNLIGGGPVCEK